MGAALGTEESSAELAEHACRAWDILCTAPAREEARKQRVLPATLYRKYRRAHWGDIVQGKRGSRGTQLELSPAPIEEANTLHCTHVRACRVQGSLWCGGGGGAAWLLGYSQSDMDTGAC